jgi:FkbM family methyltransferase
MEQATIYSTMEIGNRTVVKIRENTSDSGVVKEAFGSEYDRLRMKPEDVVLDIGMNIGGFTLRALEMGITNIYGYEPELDNFSLAAANVQMNKGSDQEPRLYNLAVIGNDDSVRTLYVNTKRSKAMHSLVPRRGRGTVEVECININTILETVKPTIIKMDIEGGEYEILKAVKSFKGVRELMLEFHCAFLNDLPDLIKYKEAQRILQKHFSRVEFPEEPNRNWNTTSLIYCHT